MIYELHRKTKSNIGDFICNPSRYFPIDATTENLASVDRRINGHHVIIGGGGLIHHKFTNYIEQVFEYNPKSVTIWGIGTNYFQNRADKTLPDVLNKCDIVGLRDYNNPYEYVPCVSCMHPLLRKKRKISHEVVYYTHASKSAFDKTGVPHMNNKETNIEKVFNFLGAGETVVTDSFHGAYWALLMGRSVQVKAWSTKFNTIKYPPIFLEDINSPSDKIHYASKKYLKESIKRNQEFYKKVQTVLSK